MNGEEAIEGNSFGEEGREPSLESQIYQIRVKGHLDASWSAWFDELTITQKQDGTTVLTGPIADQPALHGLLTKISDLCLPLLSVRRVEVEE